MQSRDNPDSGIRVGSLLKIFFRSETDPFSPRFELDHGSHISVLGSPLVSEEAAGRRRLCLLENTQKWRPTAKRETGVSLGRQHLRTKRPYCAIQPNANGKGDICKLQVCCGQKQGRLRDTNIGHKCRLQTLCPYSPKKIQSQLRLRDRKRALGLCWKRRNYEFKYGVGDNYDHKTPLVRRDAAKVIFRSHQSLCKCSYLLVHRLLL